MMVPTILIARRSSRFLIITILTSALSVTSKHHKNHSTFRAVRIHSSPTIYFETSISIQSNEKRHRLALKTSTNNSNIVCFKYYIATTTLLNLPLKDSLETEGAIHTYSNSHPANDARR